MIRYTTPANHFVHASSAFSGAFNNIVTRGFNTNIYSDIYISGYFYIFWTRLPSFLGNEVAGIGDFRKMSMVLNTAVQIPSVNLQYTEVTTGFANTNKLRIPTTIDYDRTLQISYNELSGTPMTKFHQMWITGIRDYTSGVSDIKDYGIKNYTGDLLYITTKPVHYKSQGSFGKETNTIPNANIIETAHFFSNVFPTSDNQALFSGNLEQSDKILLDMQYSFSEMFMGEGVNTFASEKLDQIIKLKDMGHYQIRDEGIDNKIDF